MREPCINPECQSRDPRQHPIYVALDEKEEWTQLWFCEACFYGIITCETCSHWQPPPPPVPGQDDPDGECRRREPPWEFASEADWCSKWRQEIVFDQEEVMALLSGEDGKPKVRHLRAIPAEGEGEEQVEADGETEDASAEPHAVD